MCVVSYLRSSGILRSGVCCVISQKSADLIYVAAEV